MYVTTGEIIFRMVVGFAAGFAVVRLVLWMFG